MPRILIAGLAAAVLIGCGTSGGQLAIQPETAGAELAHPVRFEVANEQVLEMRVFLEAPGGQRILLGNVPPSAARGFRVPSALLTRFGAPVLHADLMGSTQGFTSDRLEVDRRTRNVRWRVKPSGLTRLHVM